MVIRCSVDSSSRSHKVETTESAPASMKALTTLVTSVSPTGPTPVSQADRVTSFARMWRSRISRACSSPSSGPFGSGAKISADRSG